LTSLHERHDATISVIGWSLGGIYAREIARQHPEAVRQVITLGSPFRMRPGDKSWASGLYDQINGKGVLPPGMEVPEEEKAPLTVPATAIYSRTDGVVRWHRCIEAAGPQRESIEVRGSHSGLGHNPAVLIAVTDRLARREGAWKPFRPPLGTAQLFPKPSTWRSREAIAV
jgi:pimeloyl-ACP methyl ester carboxylesterase